MSSRTETVVLLTAEMAKAFQQVFFGGRKGTIYSDIWLAIDDIASGRVCTYEANAHVVISKEEMARLSVP